MPPAAYGKGLPLVQVDGAISPEIGGAGKDGEQDGEPLGAFREPYDPRLATNRVKEEIAQGAPLRTGKEHEDGNDGGELRSGFVFSKALRGEDLVLGSGEQSQAGNGEFARHNH